MTARARSAFLTLSVLLAACGSAAPAASPTANPPSAPAATRTPDATPAPAETQAASASPAARSQAPGSAGPASTAAASGPVVNPDGSVWVLQAPGYGAVMAGDDAVWMVFHEDNVGRDILRIDPSTNEFETVVHDLPLYPNPIHGFGVNGSIWMSSWDLSSVLQFDAETGEEIAEHRVGSHPVEPVYAYRHIWTTNIHGNSISRIDPETAEVETIEMAPPGAPIGMLVVHNDLALVGNADGLPYLINPQTMALLGQFGAGAGGECLPPMTAIDGNVWVKECSSDVLQIVNPDTRETLGEVTSPVVPGTPFYVDDVMWMPRVADGASGWDYQNFVGLNRETYEVVAEYAAPQRLTEAGYVVAFDSIWMTGLEGILRIPADTLRSAVE